MALLPAFRANYYLSYTPGRQQPFTVWYRRMRMGGEVVGFEETYAGALRRMRDDDPNQDYGAPLEI